MNTFGFILTSDTSDTIAQVRMSFENGVKQKFQNMARFMEVMQHVHEPSGLHEVNFEKVEKEEQEQHEIPM